MLPRLVLSKLSFNLAWGGVEINIWWNVNGSYATQDFPQRNND